MLSEPISKKVLQPFPGVDSDIAIFLCEFIISPYVADFHLIEKAIALSLYQPSLTVSLVTARILVGITVKKLHIRGVQSVVSWVRV